MEPLEERLLLSADPVGLLFADADSDAESLDFFSDSLIRPAHSDRDHGLADDRASAFDYDIQNIVLDRDGARDVSYDGRITIADIDIPSFLAPGHLAGEEDAIFDSLLDELDGLYGRNVVFSTDAVLGESFSTIYIGGVGDGFPNAGDYFGLAEGIDTGNLDPWDEAFVFSELIPSFGETADE